MSQADREIPLSDSDLIEVDSSPGMDLDYDDIGSTMVVEAEELESDALQLDYDEDAPTRAAMEPPPRPSVYGSFVAMETERTPEYLVVDEVLATLGSKIQSPLPPPARTEAASDVLLSDASEPEFAVASSVETPRVGIDVFAPTPISVRPDEETPVSVYESIAPVTYPESVPPPSQISASYPANRASTFAWAATFAALGSAAAALVILLLSHDGRDAAAPTLLAPPVANANAVSNPNSIAPFVAPEEAPPPNVLSFEETEAVTITAPALPPPPVENLTLVAPAPAVPPPQTPQAPLQPSPPAPIKPITSASLPVRLDPPATIAAPVASPAPAPQAPPKPSRAKTAMEQLAEEQLRR